MDLSSLKSPGKISRDTLIKIIFISIAIIITTSAFSGQSRRVGTVSFSGADMVSPSMAPLATMGGMGKALYAERGGGNSYESSADMYMGIPLYTETAGSPTFPEERKVIRNASLSLVVDDVSKATKDITDLSGRLGGWVENQNVYEYITGSLQGSLTIRVPEPKFNEALAQIKLLALRVQNEQINSSDVSAQVVDLEARLKNERAKEAQYVLILKNAVKISDVLEVTNALSNVRGQIEQLEGQINYLARQTSMSTISISLTPIANAKEVTNEWRPGLVVKESFKNLLVSLTGLGSGLIIFFVQVLPILLLQLFFIGAIVFLLWEISKRLLARLGGTPPKS